MKCNKHGKCKVEYYDPLYDRTTAKPGPLRPQWPYWDGRQWRYSDNRSSSRYRDDD